MQIDFSSTFGKGGKLKKQMTGISNETNLRSIQSNPTTTKKIQAHQRITFGKRQVSTNAQNCCKIESFVLDRCLGKDMPPQRQVMLLFDDSAMDDQLDPIGADLLN